LSQFTNGKIDVVYLIDNSLLDPENINDPMQ